jgi:hypothetical protein
LIIFTSNTLFAPSESELYINIITANITDAAYPGAVVLFLYFNYEDFDRSLLDFPGIINDIHRDDFKMLSYQELFDAMKKSMLNTTQHKEWFEYMDSRYFS